MPPIRDCMGARERFRPSCPMAAYPRYSLHFSIVERAYAVTGSALVTAALWSYGLATVGFLAFAFRLALGWRRSMRGGMLLAAILTTVLWAAAGMGVGIWPVPGMWLTSNAFDALRYAIWFTFLGSLLRGAPGTDEASPAYRVLAGWLIAIVAAGWAPVGRASGGVAPPTSRRRS